MENFRIEYMSKSEQCYHAVNIAFLIMILGIILYSLIFRGENHPIPALLTELTGEVPPSKGLSQSFSEIVRGNLIDAARINPYGLRIFTFFVLQFLFRIFFSLSVRIKSDKLWMLAISDSAISLVIFFWCFAPFISYTLKLFGSVF